MDVDVSIDGSMEVNELIKIDVDVDETVKHDLITIEEKIKSMGFEIIVFEKCTLFAVSNGSKDVLQEFYDTNQL